MENFQINALPTNESLLSHFKRESAGDLFQFIVRIEARVDFDASLCTAEGHINTSAFKSHQGRQSLDFIDVDFVRVTDTYYTKVITVSTLRKERQARGLRSS